ncbi:hypothetical protein L2E82_39103 [Cichorium intybus]|uniref:Uncharacterized protein n=1 Tax=Cichorium intybus TaxID=13427 RepID=A0ACB9AI23_CICIN|nr:hypothetical protein L2E82_39103 [Cichorium intybus]
MVLIEEGRQKLQRPVQGLHRDSASAPSALHVTNNSDSAPKYDDNRDRRRQADARRGSNDRRQGVIGGTTGGEMVGVQPNRGSGPPHQ